jgi:hypothetical protein
MVRNRQGLAPWSLSREAGIESATVDGTIEVPQNVQPVLDTGFVDEKGNWKGIKSSDQQFKIDATHEAVANGAVVLSPQATPDYIDMTGFRGLFLALKVSNGGGFAIEAVMGPATNTFANLTPVNAGSPLRGVVNYDSQQIMEAIFSDSVETMTVDVWNIFYLGSILRNQKLLQFKITNSSGGSSDIEFAYSRMV